jgi:PPP family 3-phenylpropionic acid transporter
MSAAAAAAFLAINTFWFVLLIALVQPAALAPTTSIADALTVNTARPHLAGKPLEYGWIRGAAMSCPMIRVLSWQQLQLPHFFPAQCPNTKSEPASCR